MLDFDAKAARKLTDESLSTEGGAGRQILDGIYPTIANTAKMGESALTLEGNSPIFKASWTIRNAVIAHLESQGFTVKQFSGDPREPAQQITISW